MKSDLLSETFDVVVVGGGPAGLTSAALLARAGRRVIVLERSPRLGGRAASDEAGGAVLNLGPHAIFERGIASQVLADLGVELPGAKPTGRGALALHDGRLHRLPAGPLSLLATGLLGWCAKLEVSRFLAALTREDPARLRGRSVAAWFGDVLRDPTARALGEALVRVSGYAHAPERVQADVAARQLALAIEGGVRYVDGGWQTIVDRLSEVARAAGAEVRTRAPVASIERDAHGVRGVVLRDGTRVLAPTVVAAVAPAVVRRLLPELALPATLPVRAASLDVVLDALPRPERTFALGVDRPLYFSVHSATARLAPDARAVLHAARYLAPDERVAEDELEGWVDLLQPGWREHVLARRFLPQLTVSEDLAPLDRGGARAPVESGIEGLLLAGDWVGDEGLLLDAALASARRAATLAASRALCSVT